MCLLVYKKKSLSFLCCKKTKKGGMVKKRDTADFFFLVYIKIFIDRYAMIGQVPSNLIIWTSTFLLRVIFFRSRFILGTNDSTAIIYVPKYHDVNSTDFKYLVWFYFHYKQRTTF